MVSNWKNGLLVALTAGLWIAACSTTPNKQTVQTQTETESTVVGSSTVEELPMETDRPVTASEPVDPALAEPGPEENPADIDTGRSVATGEEPTPATDMDAMLGTEDELGVGGSGAADAGMPRSMAGADAGTPRSPLGGRDAGMPRTTTGARDAGY